MYENMAEFCLLGCDECRATEPGRNSRQASRHTVRQWGMEAKVDPLHPRNRHKGG